MNENKMNKNIFFKWWGICLCIIVCQVDAFPTITTSSKIHGNSGIFNNALHPKLPNSSADTLGKASSSSSSSSSVVLHMGAEGLWNSIQTVISSSLSSSTGGNSVGLLTDVVVSTPPVAYFSALLAAGFGLPMSEDALCILVGTSLDALHRHQTRFIVIASLYAGVVLSDFVTFGIGCALRRGLLKPMRTKLIGDSATATTDVQVPTKQRKRDRIMNKVAKAGDYVGFITRLSVGMRGPMMLMTGFSGTTTFPKFAMGTMLGACVSLPIQLFLGYRMTHTTAATATVNTGVLSSIATFGILASLIPIVATFLLPIMKQLYNFFILPLKQSS